MVRQASGLRRSGAGVGASIAAIALSAALAAGCGGSKEVSAATTGSHTTGGATAQSTTGATTQGTNTATTQGAGTPGPQAVASHEVSANVVVASFGTLTASLHAAGRHPRVGRPWPIHFTVTAAGRPAAAAVAYEYLFGGAVVAHRSHYRFVGNFHDVFTWPSSALGYPLTFRAVITSAGTTLNLDYPVQVVR